MSKKPNRGRHQNIRQSGSTSTQPAVQQPASQPLSPSPELQAKTSRLKWIQEHHPVVASYAAPVGVVVALVGVVVAIVAIYIPWSQQKESNKFNQLTHLHEMAPQLVVDRFEHDELIRADEGMAARLRNVGKGVAKNAIVKVHLLRVEGKNWEPETVISRITVAPNDSVQFKFAFPAPPDGMKGDLGMMGTIGLYCQDNEGHEVLATQLFTLSFHQDEHGRHIAPTFKTPKIHPVNVNPRTSQNVRTGRDGDYRPPCNAGARPLAKVQSSQSTAHFTEMTQPSSCRSISK